MTSLSIRRKFSPDTMGPCSQKAMWRARETEGEATARPCGGPCTARNCWTLVVMPLCTATGARPDRTPPLSRRSTFCVSCCSRMLRVVSLIPRGRGVLSRMLNPRGGERILEIDPGSGRQALSIARSLGPRGILEVVDVQSSTTPRVSTVSPRARGTQAGTEAGAAWDTLGRVYWRNERSTVSCGSRDTGWSRQSQRSISGSIAPPMSWLCTPMPHA